MLPEDTKKRKSVEKQPSVTEHFGPEDRDARPIPYSDKAIEIAALKWLIETNQVCILSYFLSPMLTCGKITADHNVQKCSIQKDARHRLSIQQRHSASLTQAVKNSDHQDVPAPVVLVARPPYSSYICFLVFFSPLTSYSSHSLGPQRLR